MTDSHAVYSDRPLAVLSRPLLHSVGQSQEAGRAGGNALVVGPAVKLELLHSTVLTLATHSQICCVE